MLFLPGLAVIFAGIIGPDLGRLEKQIEALVHDLHVKPAPMPAAKLRELTHHGAGTRDIVKRLHVDGVVGFELVTGHGTPTLRVVIYDAEGALKTYSELPLAHRELDKDDLEVLRSNMEDDVSALAHTPATAPAPAVAAASDSEIEMDPTPTPAPAPTPKVAAARPVPPPPVKPQPAAKPAAKSAPAEIAFVAPTHPSDDAEAPPGLSEHPEHAPAPTETADASDSVSAADIEALTGGGDTTGGGGGAGGGGELQASGTTEPGLRIRAAIGLSVASRSFAPSPSTVAAYSSAPVGAIHLDANVQPTARTTVGVVAETTLGMTTPLRGGVASTTIARWEATASYTMTHGVVDLAPMFGIGRRSFSIDSTDPARTPDGDYNYMILGATASKALGSRVALHGILAFEPVVSGTEPTQMSFGSASRWALDLGAALEVRPRAHVFMRAAADYQRFAWSWDSAGARGAGGAVDGYPSGTFSLGAEY